MRRILLSALAGIVLLQACKKSDDNGAANVSSETKQAFASKYPNANDVTWRTKNNYIIASFNNSQHTTGAKSEAWFNNSGAWYMTEIDLGLNQLPDVIKKAYAASAYSQWTIDDIDVIEREGFETIYVLEVEKGEQEFDLYFSTDGILIKEVADKDDDNDYEDYIPSDQTTAIKSFISTNYPLARILELEREGQYIEVEILDGKVKRELQFNAQSQWIQTITEVRFTDLPLAVQQSFKTSQYASWEIDDIYHHKLPTKAFYRFELELGSKEAIFEVEDAVLFHT